MADTPRREEWVKALPVEKDGEIGRGYARYNEFSPNKRKVELVEGMPKKAPFEPVESLFEINLNCHGAFLAFGGCHGVNDFLGNNDVVLGIPSRNKASLEMVNAVTKVGFQLAYQNFVIVL